MEKIKLHVSGSQIQVVQRPAAITAGTVGLEAEFSFDSHWDNLGKTVIFRAGDKVITAALERDTHIVPWEVLEKPDLWLVVGVYGANPEGTVVIPTLWTKVAAVYTGVEPEGDPALEPSNPIWQQTVARVANMEPQLQKHISDMNNPHGITCDQIGAVTQKEFRDVVSNLDGSSDQDQVIPHLLNRDNPHGVTAEQVGAAPDGFGLGEIVSPTTGWNYAKRSGFTHSSGDSPDGTVWWGIINARDGGVGTHIAFSNADGILTEAKRNYKTQSSKCIGEWEYANPPMLKGKEYRTTDRINGKAVYKTLTSTGMLQYRIDGENTSRSYPNLIGAAPAGYGLGTGAPYGANVDNIFNGGFYRWDVANEQTPFANGVMIVVPREKDDSATQLAFCNAGTEKGVMAVRATKSDGIGEWEYINPPMNTGIVYRTTDRINGKAVYKVLNSDGTLHYRLDGETTFREYPDLIGAAPAGYGLGTVAVNDTPVSNANNVYRCGWYRVNESTTNGVGYVGVMRVDSYSSDNIIQTVYQFNRADFCPTRQRVCLNGVWSEWDWINPPMFNGIEYRTTKLHEGKPVYTKQVNLQGVSAGGTKTVIHGIENILTPLNVKLFDADGTITEAATYLRFTKTNISFTLPSDVGGKTVYGIFEYTKV